MNFSFYQADPKYCDFLRQFDPCIPYTAEQNNTRPFIGIVLTINEFSYYAPLTSPKPKHIHMKNQQDFLKLNEGVWGAINLNNMIPIHPNSLSRIDMHILPSDNKATVNYKNLLMNQLSWCNETQNMNWIITKAEKLYELVCSGKARPELLNRCCNFLEDEKQCRTYCKMQNWLLAPTSDCHSDTLDDELELYNTAQ